MRLRYFNAAGADPGAEIGEHHDPETHLIPLVCHAAAGVRPNVKIYGNDYPTRDGTALRDFVHVSDLARGHVFALEYLLQGGETIAINFGSGQCVSVREVIDTFQTVTGQNVCACDASRRSGDPTILAADIKRAREVLGWVPERSILLQLLLTLGGGIASALDSKAGV